MLYANLPNGSKSPPSGKGQRAECPNCKKEVIGKFGQIVIPHWAHPADRECDPWGEPEGPWHLGWKSLVQAEQVEVTMKRVIDGVEHHHRADIVGLGGVVVELQHSSISPETIQARESFYGDMVWVFDASYLVGSSRLQRIKVCDDQPYLLLPELLEAWRSSDLVKWSHFKRSLEVCSKQIYLDFGVSVEFDYTSELPKELEGIVPSEKELRKYPQHLVRAEGGLSMMRISSIQTGGLLEGRLISRNHFLNRHLRGVLADDSLRSEVATWVQDRVSHIQVFRKARAQERAVELQRKQRIEEEVRLREAKVLEAKRLQEEKEARAREAEEKARQEFLQMVQRFDYDRLIRYRDGVNRFTYSELEVIEKKRVELVRKMERNLLEMDPARFAEVKKAVVASVTKARTEAEATVQLKRWTATQDDSSRPPSVAVVGPYDAYLIQILKGEGYTWDKSGRRWMLFGGGLDTTKEQEWLDKYSEELWSKEVEARVRKVLPPKALYIFYKLSEIEEKLAWKDPEAVLMGL